MERIGPNPPDNRVESKLSIRGPYAVLVTQEGKTLFSAVLSRIASLRIQRVRDVLDQYQGKGYRDVRQKINALGFWGWQHIVVPASGIRSVTLGPDRYKQGKETILTLTDETGESESFLFQEPKLEEASVALVVRESLYINTNVK